MSDQQTKNGGPPPGSPVLALDPETVGKHFDSAAAEIRWDEVWQEEGIYHWDPSRPREQTYVVDTPPPTASGSLHVGHVFSSKRYPKPHHERHCVNSISLSFVPRAAAGEA